jgi:hypothetical protein
VACSRLPRLSVLVLAGCGLWGEEAPTAPPRGAAPSAAIASAPSTILVPLSIDLTELQEAIQEQVPSILFVEEGKELDRGVLADIQVSRQGDVQLQGREDGQLRLVIPLHLHVDAYHSIQVRNRKKDRDTRKVPLDADLSLFIDLALNISGDWRMQSVATASYRWEVPPVLRLGRLSLDLTETIDEKLSERMPRIAERIEGRLAERDRLPSRIATVWDNISGARPLPKPEGAWLLIEPTALFVSAPVVSGDAIRLTGGMTGTVSTALGDEPVHTPLPLPPRTAPPPGGDDGLRLGVDVALSWVALAEQASGALQGRQWPLMVSGTETGTLTVTGIELYPSGTLLAVGVSYLADSMLWESEGVLWLTGTPVLDVEAQRLSVDDFDYVVDTTDTALSGVNAEVIREKLRDQVRDNLSFPFGDAISEQIALANEQLRSVTLPRGGTLTAELDSAELKAIRLTDEALAVRVELRGTAELRLPPPPPPGETP